MDKVLPLHKVADLLDYLQIKVEPRTIERYCDVLQHITVPKDTLENIMRGVTPTSYDGMVIKKNVPIYSYCAHHILPWFGSAHMGYIADGKLLGASKFARIARYFSSGLTIQEDVTKAIADFFVKEISPHCMVVIEAIHSCEVARGVENPFSPFVTQDVRGLFRDNYGPRMEFLTTLNKV